MRIPTEIETKVHTGGLNVAANLSREWVEEATDEEIAMLVRRLYERAKDEPKAVKLTLDLPAQSP
jgi:hypothetical protein